ncbi:MAG TPA: response regulator [Patescibacteria group bacterium]|jgi:CheY-like chemotaxis protein|nr:response regulator [Patescibacteria group bacterium]
MPTTDSASKQKLALVVENNEAMIEALQLKLKAAKVESMAVRNGEEALAYLSNNKPDIILLDLVLPQINGWEVLRIIKASERLKDIPVIILTNLGLIQEIEKGKTMGAVDYLIKSNTSINDVVKTILKHI